MSEKRSVWELQLKDSVQNKLNPLNSAADKTAAKFAGLQDKINKTELAMSGLSSQVPMLNMLTSPNMLAGAGVAAIGAGLFKAGHLAYDFETNMAKINATAQLSEGIFGQLGDRVQEIASDSGGNFEKVPEAYEKILSQTGKVNLSLDILETSLKGAKTGFASIDLVGGAVARTLSIVGEKNATADEVLDTLLKAKAVGAGEFGDFAQYIPQLVASGDNLSVAFEDTAGIFAYMTAKGQSAADSAMLIQNAFTALQKENVMSGLEKSGIHLFNAEGERRNIKDVFVDLSKKLDGLSDKQKSKFFIDIGLNDAQAKNAFSVLTSDAEKFKSIMYDVNHAVGETDRQLAMTGNHARDWGSIFDEFKSWGVSIGDFLLPVVDALISGISGIARDLKFILTGGIFTDQAAHDDVLKQANQKYAGLAAEKLTKQKFGEDNINTKEAGAFFNDAYQNFMKQVNGLDSKNNIVKGEDKLNPFKKPGESLNTNLQSGLESISGGGAQVRNVIVNITKMVENINIHAASVKESGSEMVRDVEEIMLRAINGGEQALMNG